MKRKCPGILPNPHWLNGHGYTGLTQAMRRDPKAFAHIKQDHKGGRSAREWVLIAETLAKEHGQLPNFAWLKEHGYYGLAQAKANRPQLFAHIKQTKKWRSPQEWLPVVKSLVQQHGKLPCSGWLRRNGYDTLDHAIRTHPCVFRSFAQEWKGGRSAKDWVSLAEKLAAKHNGAIPCTTWLMKNHHHGLYKMLLEHPKLFRHIRRTRRPLVTADKWVPIAEELAKKNGDILPRAGWLCKYYGGLYAAVRTYPHLFAHIKQHKKHRKPKEWVIIAEQLTKKHGMLPNHQWLATHGYLGLTWAKKTHPEMFRHIKQRRLRPYVKLRKPHEWVTIAEKLAKQSGHLPIPTWLIHNGYDGMYQAMRRHPQLFTHIRRRKP